MVSISLYNVHEKFLILKKWIILSKKFQKSTTLGHADIVTVAMSYIILNAFFSTTSKLAYPQTSEQ